MSIYDDELGQLDQEKANTYSGGGSDYNYYEVAKPSRQGQTVVQNLRIIQRLHTAPDGTPDPSNPHLKFWVRTDRHGFKIDGQFKSFNCPEDRTKPDWKEHMTCPLCILSEELFRSRQTEYVEVAKRIAAKKRCYANVIDLDNPASHWEQQSDGTYKIAPKVFAFSQQVHRQIMQICSQIGPVEDWQIGRDLILSVEKTGPLAINIKYDIRNKDQSAIPNEYLPIVQSAHDLESMGTPATFEELRDAAIAADPRPGGASYAAPPPAQRSAPPSTTTAPPPTAAAPPAAPPPVQGPFTYSGPSGQQQGLTADRVAQLAMSGTPGQHSVWMAGWSEWRQADQVPEVQALLQAMAPKPAAPPPGPPPPNANPYQGQGGYALPPAAPPTAPAPPPAAPAPPPAAPPAAPPPAAPPAAPPPAAPPAAPPPAPPTAPAPPPAAPAPPTPPSGGPPAPPAPPGQPWS